MNRTAFCVCCAVAGIFLGWLTAALNWERGSDSTADSEPAVTTPAADWVTDPEAREVVTHQAASLVNEGRRADWLDADEDVKLVGCYLYVHQRAAGLDDSAAADVALQFREALNELFAVPREEDSVLHWLAVLLVSWERIQ